MQSSRPKVSCIGQADYLSVIYSHFGVLDLDKPVGEDPVEAPGAYLTP